MIRKALIVGLLISNPAVADEKIDRGHGFYFNRPGATTGAMLSDQEQCRAIATGAQSQINAASVVFGGLGAVLGGAFAGKRLQRVNVENCMLVRGWRLVAMTRAEGSAFEALSPAAQRTEIETLAGQETPTRGRVLRIWHNDYAEPQFFEKAK